MYMSYVPTNSQVNQGGKMIGFRSKYQCEEMVLCNIIIYYTIT